jgi:hypothetical protein
MKISRPVIVALTATIGLLQLLIKFYFFPDWFIFGRAGDDFYYHELMKIWETAPFSIDGLVALGQKNTYSYFFRYIIIKNPIVHSILILTFFVYASVRFYYKLLSLTLSYRRAIVLYLLFLVSPLKYIWIFSHYKESVLIVIVLLFATNKIKFVTQITTVLLRPLLGFSLILTALLGLRLRLRILFFSIAAGGILYIVSKYEWIWNLNRINNFIDKIPQLVENSLLNTLATIIVFLVLLIILPIFKSAGTSSYSAQFDSIVPIVNADFILNMPVSIMLLYNIRHLKITQESVVYFAYVLGLLFSLMFLTNRHLLVVEPFKYLVLAQIYGYKKLRKRTGTAIC